MSSNQRLKEIMEHFHSKRVLVLGDFCLDEYIHCKPSAISPEAPVLRHIVQEKKYVPGAAGNVACGIAALGAQTHAVGVIGQDINGKILSDQLSLRGIHVHALVKSRERNTATYSRIVTGGHNTPTQHSLRFDVENDKTISPATVKEIENHILALIPNIDAIIVADYDEVGDMGIVSRQLLARIVPIAQAHKVKLIGDSRVHFDLFKDFTTIVPNDAEVAKVLEKNLESEADVIEAGLILRSKLNLEMACITRGKDGISVISAQGHERLPTQAKRIVDVCGGGDSVTCAMTLALLSDASPADAATLANYCASVSVAHEGTYAVTIDDLRQSLDTPSGRVGKVLAREDVPGAIQRLRMDGKRVVFINGYFDPLHIGHLQIVKRAKKLGDVLIVGVNSDQSVRDNKGPGRPFMSQEHRSELLEGLEEVDHVVVFEELTPIKLIKQIRPDVIAKGSNYSKEEVIGKEIVESYGGEVVLLDHIKGFSSDKIIEMHTR